jgi:hypothetical protein
VFNIIQAVDLTANVVAVDFPKARYLKQTIFKHLKPSQASKESSGFFKG